MLSFPQSSSGRPWARLDARTGLMFISSPEGDKLPVDLKGKALGFDIANAKQGWLSVGTAGADWQDLPDGGGWGNPPSADHKPAVDIDIWCNDPAFGDAKLRTSRGNSRAFTQLVQEIAKKVGDVQGGAEASKRALPLIRIDAVRIVKVGQGTSVSFDFTLAQIANWVPRAGAAEVTPNSAAPAQRPIASLGGGGDSAAEF